MTGPACLAKASSFWVRLVSDRYPCDPPQLGEQDRGEPPGSLAACQSGVLVFHATFHPLAIRLVLCRTCLRRIAS
ncbi:unnamed protein product [Didymodactylos carnosus]|uniref:Uncharacterized protein n=1 Tax=Didymodactylos carnosus TaxID=1234261 RepID=A0A8S2KAS9_9BILA|nr:unnamed protein product [Didymodactylos carnosus]CAF3833294.1 unnamed protein product [Didymodactylos carnosus]